VNKHSLVSMTEFWHATKWDLPVNTDIWLKVAIQQACIRCVLKNETLVDKNSDKESC